MKGNATSHFNFHDLLNVKFSTNNLSFYRFVVENFRFFHSNTVRTHRSTGKYEMSVVVNFTKEDQTSHKSYRKITSNVFINGNRILFLDHGLESTVILEYLSNDSIRITASVVHARKKGLIQKFLDFYEKFLRNDRFRSRLHERYMMIMREVIHLPLLYILQKDGFVLLHGSAVEKDGKAYLFIGGNAVGKTTLALYLVFKFGFKFLSDDFLLIKDSELLGFIEKLRVPEDIYQKIVAPHLENNLGAQTKIYDKYHFLLPSVKTSKLATIHKIFFLEFSHEPALKKIDHLKATRRLMAIHNYLHEFPEYSYLVFSPDFPFLTETALRNMLKGRQLYLFCMSGDLDKNVNTLIKEVK